MKGYFSLCYHYIRPEKDFNLYPDLLGNTGEEFRSHLRFLKKKYRILTPQEAYDFSCKKKSTTETTNKYGMLITFDDGLSDHLLAAKIMNEEGVRGMFFIPTCIFKDKLPANPIIIHYALAIYRITGFLFAYESALKKKWGFRY